MALKGLRVLEFAGLAPAPHCGMILADFGASVIKIDKLNYNSELNILDHGKQTISVDLKKKEATNIVKKLSKISDVVIEPFRPGVMESLGLGPNDLLKDNPQLIYARLTGFGDGGYYSKRAGHDINYLAVSGLLSLLGRKKENPLFPLNLAADFGGGGLTCALGIMLALFERSKSGIGQVVDNSMVEGAAYLGSWVFRSQNLHIWGNERGDNMLDSGAHFYEVYETKDGKFISVGAIEPTFYKVLIEGLGLNEDTEQFDFENGKKMFQKKFLEKTQEEWCQIFNEKDACVFPVLSMDEAMNHKHNRDRKSFIKSSDNLICPNPAPRLSRTPGVSQAANNTIPNIGNDTESVLKTVGYSDKEILELNKNSVIKTFQSKM